MTYSEVIQPLTKVNGRPEVAIVVVAYNNVDVIGDLLDSLPAALDGLKADVVVVDNGSSDGTGEFVAARGGCKVVWSSNVGYAGGINRGVRAAIDADAILILNADVRLWPGSIRSMRVALRDPHVGIVAPQIRSPEGALDLSLRRTPSLLRALGLTWTKLPAFSEYVVAPGDYETTHVVDWALGAVLLMSRQCYDAIGGWDESYFLYSEETDVSLRARDLGLLTCYVPGAVAVHLEGQSGRGHKTHAMLVINRVRLYRRRHSLAASWCFYGLVLANQMLWLIRGRRESWTAVKAILVPTLRPPELCCSDRLMPS